jgi:hypothetical protein
MDDAVIDVTVVAFANGPISARPGGALARCLPVIRRILDGRWRCRYNAKLLQQYEDHVKTRRNDIIDSFFELLDSERAVPGRNNLRHHEYAMARKIRWPTHDHYLLAAAIDGINPSIVVTEPTLAQLGAQARREFGVAIVQV